MCVEEDGGGAGGNSTALEYRARFDRLFNHGNAAVLSGAHFVDVPPVEGGRWGLSCAFVSGGEASSRLAAVTADALTLAGDRHWPTGAPASVHFTVRAIQVYRSGLSWADPLVARCAAAMEKAAAVCGRVRLRLDGLTLTPSGVMVCAYPIDNTADAFAIGFASSWAMTDGLRRTTSGTSGMRRCCTSRPSYSTRRRWSSGCPRGAAWISGWWWSTERSW